MAATLWKGHLAFGLVSIPIKLVRAARAEKIHMHRLQRETGQRVRQVFVPRSEEPEEEAAVAEEVREEPKQVARPAVAAKAAEPIERPPEQVPAVQPAAPAAAIPRQDLVRGYEYEKDKYVAFEPGELETLAPRNSTTMDILEFVRLAEVDPVYFETSYYVIADKGGEKPYALLFAALQKTGYSGIAEFVMHRRDQVILLRPGRQGILAHTLFHEDEVKRENEFHADKALVEAREEQLAVKFIEALEAKFEPAKFKDNYRERLRAAIAEKMESGQKISPAAASQPAPVIDIMEALKRSLSDARKPPASEGRKPAKKRARS
jgi:DNA end-binding protein Ku